MRCVCHSLNLCAKKATAALPNRLEYFVREAHNYFSNSPKRLEKYKDLYETINNSSNSKKNQGLSGIRWLARCDAIETIIDQWEELKTYFLLNEKECYAASQLHDTMSRLPYKAFLIFLKSVLKIVTQLNVLFQSDNIEPTKLFEDLFLMFKSLLKKIVVPAQLQKVKDSELVNFDFMPHLMHTSSLNFSYELQSIAEYLNPTDLKDVKERCKNFWCVLASEI
ncbi:unnamed protein product [Euphydryas editha]|uniref:Transposase n=1 Tax=Euphydryas editha TaxID=104508 RepID=A0AAU9TQL4_EUPED|nr:unnamed protein product [Euphydryas editha]